MFPTLILSITLAIQAPNPRFLVGDTLYPFNAVNIQESLRQLPRTDSAYAQLGIMFTTAVFAKSSAEPRRDADSALYYLRKAQQLHPMNPVISSYLCAARLLRAQYGYLHETALISDTLKLYFARLDSLAAAHPGNVVVEFIASCIFQNAHPIIGNADWYWAKSRRLLLKLQKQAAIEGTTSSFFTDEVKANILLNLAYLQTKLDQVDSSTRHAALNHVIVTYPNTWAADRASEVLQKEKVKNR